MHCWTHGLWAAAYAQARSLRGALAALIIMDALMSGLDRVSVGNLRVAKVLHDFIVEEVIPGTGIDAAAFWRGLDRIVHAFAPRNRALLERRDALQAGIDAWYRDRRGQPLDVGAQKSFLTEIGYLVPEGPDFTVDTANIDDEIAAIAGPQLVVPVSNARYALNAANARWGSLYDALYGSDAIARDPQAAAQGYDPARGKQVIAWARHFLDEAAPLASGSHADARGYAIKNGALAVALADGKTVGLKNPGSWPAIAATPPRRPPFFWSTTACMSSS